MLRLSSVRSAAGLVGSHLAVAMAWGEEGSAAMFPRIDPRSDSVGAAENIANGRAVLTQRHKGHNDFKRDMQVEDVTRAEIGPMPAMVCFSWCSLCEQFLDSG